MKTSIGRIVVYNTTESERKALNALGDNSQEQLPAIIVAAWSDECVNLKVLSDGRHPDLWRTSINIGDEPGQWNWPEKV